jgi:hypothetical protein
MRFEVLKTVKMSTSVFWVVTTCGLDGKQAYVCFRGTSRVAQSVQCLTTDRTAGVLSPTEAEAFSSSLCVQTGSGAHPASYTMGTGGSFPEGKAQPGRDADHSPPSTAGVKKE